MSIIISCLRGPFSSSLSSSHCSCLCSYPRSLLCWRYIFPNSSFLCIYKDILFVLPEFSLSVFHRWSLFLSVLSRFSLFLSVLHCCSKYFSLFFVVVFCFSLLLIVVLCFSLIFIVVLHLSLFFVVLYFSLFFVIILYFSLLFRVENSLFGFLCKSLVFWQNEQIALFKRANHSFCSFCKEQQEEITLVTLLIKAIHSHRPF